MLWFKKKEERAEENTQVVGNTISSEDPVFRSLLGGDIVTRDMAMQVPTVSGGIDLIANIIASTPIKLYMDVDGKAKEVTGDRRVRLLNEDPGDTLTANEFWRAMVEDYYLGKGGYAYINWNLNDIDSLHYVKEQDIAVIRNYNPIFKDYDILVNGVRYPPYKFFRILRNTKDGAEGVPITQESSKLISVAYNSLVFELNMSKRGGTKRGFLRSEKKLDNDALASLRVAFRKLYNGSSEDSFVLLNNGIDFKESSATGAEMQLNENKVTNAEEFAKIFHISTKTMSGKATDADTASLAKLAAIPLMKVITSALNRDLLLEKEKDTYYFAFDTKELLKGDMKSRFDAYKVALDANFMQIDEVRYMEDLEELGFNWIKLGLQDVLYDPVTRRIFTPNTGKMENLQGISLKQAEEDGKIESRANPNHDPKTGRFTSGAGKGAFPDGNKNRVEKELTSDENKGIIKSFTTGKSLGAAEKKYSVKLPDSNQHVKLGDGQKITGKTFAGKGTNKDIKVRYILESKYNIPAKEFEKVSGKGDVIINGKKVTAELHWYEANGEKFEMKIKRILK